MSESKTTADEHDDAYLRSLPVVDIEAVDVSPNPAPLTAELNLEVDFRLDKPVRRGVWHIEVRYGSMERHAAAVGLMTTVQYLVDSVTKRHIIFLGRVQAQDYDEGANHFQFSVDEINVDGIQPSQLTNCGLLIASFKHDDGDIMDLKMVVQVSSQRDLLQRIVYNPLE